MRRLKNLIPFLAFLWIAGGGVAGAEILGEISSIRNLPKEEAAKNLPVEISATILIRPGKGGPLVVTDGTAIWCLSKEFVAAGGNLPDLGPGISCPSKAIRKKA